MERIIVGGGMQIKFCGVETQMELAIHQYHTL